jgi:phosphoglycolate phosphatase-like HAD superfamily hydrolase
VQTVLTGNIAPVARIKLAAFDLDRHLDLEIGAYGADDRVRANLVPMAQRRAGARHAAVFDRSNTVVVGDTLHDVAAGRDGGARVVAVASGRTPASELRAAGADAVLPDLADTAAVLRAVAG